MPSCSSSAVARLVLPHSIGGATYLVWRPGLTVQDDSLVVVKEFDLTKTPHKTRKQASLPGVSRLQRSAADLGNLFCCIKAAGSLPAMNLQ